MVNLSPFLPFLVIISLLWTAWDPTYSAFRKAQLQGRDVRVKGKREYIVSRAPLINRAKADNLSSASANDNLVPSTLHHDHTDHQALYSSRQHLRTIPGTNPNLSIVHIDSGNYCLYLSRIYSSPLIQLTGFCNITLRNTIAATTRHPTHQFKISHVFPFPLCHADRRTP